MGSPVKRSISRLTVSLIAVGVVFGFAFLMVLKQYDPAVITTVVTGTSLAAAELVRRLQAPSLDQSDLGRVRQPDRNSELDGTADQAPPSSPGRTPPDQS
ncbi:hypothetical protein [Acrocarpospora pleiomorpha]|nr:hypothetical protein [Acrocarpospora pleiomorpha]